MNDLVKFKTLLDSFGIKYRTIHNTMSCSTQVSIEADDSDECAKIQGYSGFKAIFTFNHNKEFHTVGIWE